MTDPNDPRSHNRRAWDERVRRKARFTKPSDAEAFADPARSVDPSSWFGNLRGKRVLCLASGGGRHGPLFAAAGAEVTVVDLSPAMLEIDEEMADRHGVSLTTHETSMDDLSSLGDASFDLVNHPVSTCYVEDILAVYREVARVLAPSGLYVSQHKQPSSLQGTIHPHRGVYAIVEPYYREGALPAVEECLVREAGTLEYLHRWEEILGGLCRSGFVIEDVIEPRHAKVGAQRGSFEDRSLYLPPYIRIKARRLGSAPGGGIWVP